MKIKVMKIKSIEPAYQIMTDEGTFLYCVNGCYYEKLPIRPVTYCFVKNEALKQAFDKFMKKSSFRRAKLKNREVV